MFGSAQSAEAVSGYLVTMLHKFLTENRQLLIARCKEKVAKRFGPTTVASPIEHGVPLFLEQLVETLKAELTTSTRGNGESEPTPAATAIGRAAALHGAELLRRGFTVDQVVHDYGDVCQAVTALAVEQGSAISIDEFRTLNRCLDNAIADAVASFGEARQVSLDRQSQTAKSSLADHNSDQRRLIAIATQSFSAIKSGNIGPGGATGDLLEHTLKELLALTDRLDPPPVH
jgi:hypothetical protein